jgi:zinc protease
MKNKIFSSFLTGLASFLLCLWIASDLSALEPFGDPDKIEYPGLEFRIPRAERIVLENGIILFYLPDHELPMVSIAALVRTGAINDPPGKEGVAELTASVMVTGGTSKVKSTDMDKRLDFLAATPSVSMSIDFASIHFSFFKTDLDECLNLLSQILKEPAFEKERLDLALSLKNADLRRISDNPQRLAFREFNRLLYQDDPRGRYATLDSLLHITREDLVVFHKNFFFPSNMLMTVCGDISKEEAIKKINQYLGDWKDSRSLFPLPPPPQKTGHGFFFVRKERPQSVVVNGELAPGKKDPDYYAFLILDFIAGSGGFPSRIFTAVRNNEGLAYSAGSFYRARSNYGVFGTYAFTKTSSTFQSLDLMNTILRDLSTRPISTAELDWAKKSILNSFIFSFEQPSQIAEQQMSHAYDQLPDDYLVQYREHINAVTIDDIRRVASRNLNESKRLTLISGDTDHFGKMPDKFAKPVFISPQ